MRAVCLVVLWCLSMVSHAVIVPDLYRVRVPVTDQSAASQAAGIQEALQLLVVKVSGQSLSVQTDAVQQAAAEAERYVKSFRYSRDDGEAGLQLEVTFAQNLIDDLLNKSGLPVWGKSRPLVLLWQGVEDDRQRLVVNQAETVWRSQLEAAMNERGIPLLWPALDLQDEAALPVARLWGLFRQDISAASERYMADAVMAGRLSPSVQGGWQYTGFLHHKDDWLELQAQDEEVSAVLRQVAGQVAEFMSGRYAVISDGSAGGHQLVIQGIESFRQYHDVITYLSANVAVNAVHVVAVNQQELTLELDLAAEWPQVWSMLALDKRLQSTEQDSVYRWRQ